MKTKTNGWLIIAAALIMIGILGFFVIMSIAGWDFAALGNAKYKTDTIATKKDFRNISIDSDTEDITFLSSADGQCRIEFFEHEKVTPVVSVQDGTLSIGVDDTRKWYESLSLFFSTPKITVYLPQDEYDSLAVENDTGDIIIPGEFTFGSISIKAGTGNVGCNASSTGPVRIKTGTGHININNISAGDLDLSVSTGKIEARSVTCEGTVGVSVSTGKTLLKDVSCSSLLSEGSTGDITLENVTASEKIEITRSTGDVKFDQCDAGEISVKTDTGDVTGSLLSEKIFITESNTGRIDVPETVNGGKCKIRTNTGKIIITTK